MKAGEWSPTPQLRWCVGTLQQAWTRECSEWRPSGMRGLVHTWNETEWRDVRQATDEEIAALRASAVCVHEDEDSQHSTMGFLRFDGNDGYIVKCRVCQTEQRRSVEKSERCPHGYELVNLRDGTDICAGCRFGVEAHETFDVHSGDPK